MEKHQVFLWNILGFGYLFQSTFQRQIHAFLTSTCGSSCGISIYYTSKILTYFFRDYCSMLVFMLVPWAQLPSSTNEKQVGAPWISDAPMCNVKKKPCKWVLPSRELTYPTLGKGKSSSKCHFGGDMLVPWRVSILAKQLQFGCTYPFIESKPQRHPQLLLHDGSSTFLNGFPARTEAKIDLGVWNTYIIQQHLVQIWVTYILLLLLSLWFHLHCYCYLYYSYQLQLDHLCTIENHIYYNTVVKLESRFWGHVFKDKTALLD